MVGSQACVCSSDDDEDAVDYITKIDPTVVLGTQVIVRSQLLTPNRSMNSVFKPHLALHQTMMQSAQHPPRMLDTCDMSDTTLQMSHVGS